MKEAFGKPINGLVAARWPKSGIAKVPAGGLSATMRMTFAAGVVLHTHSMASLPRIF
jgi:hypothetical protein